MKGSRKIERYSRKHMCEIKRGLGRAYLFGGFYVFVLIGDDKAITILM